MKYFTVIFLLFFVTNLSFSQSELPKLFSISPNYSIAGSQILLHGVGTELGFGQYNERNFYYTGVIGYNYYFNTTDEYDRTVKSHGFNAGVKFKVLVLGENRYHSARWIENTRLCFDAAVRYHINPTKSYNAGDILRNEGLVSYISSDFGFSIMLPYPVIKKNVVKILNWSDLYLEFYESIIVHNDIGLISSSSSQINNVTLAGKVMLSWVYQFQFGE